MNTSRLSFAPVVGLLLLSILFCSAMGGKPEAEKAAPLQAERSGERPASVSSVNFLDASQAGDPYVFSLRGAGVSVLDHEVLRRNAPLVVTFSGAMVKKEALDQPVPAADMPFALEPGVKGEGRWLTDKSFAFVAAEAFRPGTEYALQLKDELRALDGRPVRCLFSFRTERPKLREVLAGDHDPAGRRQLVHLSFSMPVSEAQLAEHLSFMDAASGERLDMTIAPGPEEGRRHTVAVLLGKDRSRLTMTLRQDGDSDASPLGLAESYKAELNIAADTGVTAVQAVEGAPSSIRFYKPYTSEDEQGKQVAFFGLSESLNIAAQKDYIELSPPLPYVLGPWGDSLVVREGLEPGMTLSVTLKPGLTDAAGRVLKEARSQSLTVDDRDPAVRFAEPGNILTPASGSRVGLSLVNLDQVTLTLQRQYDNNLPFMALSPDYRALAMMRDMSFVEVPVKRGEKNEVQRRAVDLEEATKGARGVFLLTARGYRQGLDDGGRPVMVHCNTQERLVVLSDIAVTARVFPAGITVFLSSISTAKPLAGAEVSLYSASNQLLFQGVTGPDGMLIHERGEAWDSQLLPSVITARSGRAPDSDITFLPLSYESSIEQADPAMRDYLNSGYEAYAYTPRGVFRPGETVDVKAFVRDPAHNPPPSFPVLVRVTSSRGLEAARGAVTLSAEGGADFAFTLPPSAPTGEYTASIEIPGQNGRVIGGCSFAVEDFAPPRLEVGVSPEAERLLADEALKVGLSGQYLFGAPGAGLAFELGYRVTPKPFAPEAFPGYVFGDQERSFDAQTNLKFISGALGESGRAEAALKAPADWLPPALLHVLLIGAVQEDGGRWVNQTGTLTYFPTPYLLGLKLAQEALEPGKPGTVDIVAVEPDGALARSGRLRAEVSLVQGNWHTVYRNGRYVYTWDERLIPQERQSLESDGGRAELTFTPRQYGLYLVRVATEDGGIVASRRFTAQPGDGYGAQEGTGRMDRVELSFDKPEYRVGETAKLTVKAPYAGTLLLGLERGAQLSARVVDMDQPSVVLDIPVSEAMEPNITVTAWVIRPVREENREWYAHRAHGMATLMLSRAPHLLRVSPATPERALPGAPLAVPFTVTDEHGTPVEGEFSAALIDEGILSLTAFKTPDPAAYFLERRRAVGNSYDAFDALLRPELRSTPLLKPGGDMAEAYYGSLSTQQVFLTAYAPVVRTDANGQGEAVFAIPEYSGKGRLMIVGASGRRFASAEAPVRVGRDIVVESSAPRAVAPGDAFELSVKVFRQAAAEGAPLTGEALISVEAEGPLTLSGDLSAALPLEGEDAAGAARTLAVRAKAEQLSGVGRVTVTVSVPGREDAAFSKSLEVVVRPPYPRTSVTAAALLKAGESKDLTAPGPWLAGSVSTAFSLGRSPVLAVLPVLEYLREYPYYCLEQLTARAWPYLTLRAVNAALYPELDGGANDAASLADIVARILAMQTPEGGFCMWPGYAAADPWKSVNAMLFLLEAKSRTPVPRESLEGGLGYMRLLLSLPADALGSESHAYSTKAYAAFVLTRAGEAPLGWIQHLSEREEAMLPSGRIFLAGAKALKAGNPAALKALGGRAVSLEGLELGDNPSMESELRNLSLRLYLWSLLAPTDETARALCLDVADRLHATRQLSTQEAGMAALALGTWLEKTGGADAGAFAATVRAAGREDVTAQDGEPVLFASRNAALEADGAAPPVRVSMDKGQGYCVYTVRGVPLAAPAPRSSHLTVQRVWKDADGKVLDLSTGAVRLQKGDRVTVELTVGTDKPVRDVAVSDLLPGGMEVENPRLEGTAAGALAGDGEAFAGAGMFMDLREDRLLVFFDKLDNTATYRYSMRAVSKGSFVLPPLAADAMYAPDYSALTPSGALVVE